MCPQLASNVRWNGNYVFGNDMLLARPHLSSVVAATIAGWSVTEAHLGRAFALLIGAKQPVTMSMYASARSFEFQRDLLMAAVSEVMPRRYAILFQAALGIMKKAASDRNKFAHWIWGASADPAFEALFLVEPKHFWNLTAAQTRFWKRKALQFDTLGAYFASPKLAHEHIYVYQLKDLQESLQRVERAFRIAEALKQLADADAPRRRLLYKWLCTEPDIQKAVKATKKNFPSARKARRKPQDKHAK